MSTELEDIIGPPPEWQGYARLFESQPTNPSRSVVPGYPVSEWAFWRARGEGRAETRGTCRSLSPQLAQADTSEVGGGDDRA